MDQCCTCKAYSWDMMTYCIMYRQIESEADVRILQNDLEILEWERTWKMKLNMINVWFYL